MHSFTVKAAIAAFVLSTALSGAYAASSNAAGSNGASSNAGHSGSASSNAGHSSAAASNAGHSSAAASNAGRSGTGRSGQGTNLGLGVDEGLALGLSGVPRGFDDPTEGKESPFEIIYNSPGYADQMYIAPEQTGRAAMTNPGTSTRHPHQRLSHVMGELGATNHRIAVDSKRGYLTASETARVRHEERAIRNAATRTADANGGVLPLKSYERLQADIQGLNRQIHHYATA